MVKLLKGFLEHPLTRGMDVYDEKTTALRLQIVRSKPFLRKIYSEWYKNIASYYTGRSKVLEIGSGAGFLREFLPQLITSDLFIIPGVDYKVDARDIKLEIASLEGIILTNVLHHIPDCNLFFQEAVRVVKKGGSVIMIEPWNTTWSRLIYQKLHHEPFITDWSEWRFPSTGKQSAANGALPWIVFERDKHLFEELYPNLIIHSIRPFMPFAYLLSGGMSMRNLAPGWLYPVVRFIEKHINEEKYGMFALIVLKRA